MRHVLYVHGRGYGIGLFYSATHSGSNGLADESLAGWGPGGLDRRALQAAHIHGHSPRGPVGGGGGCLHTTKQDLSRQEFAKSVPAPQSCDISSSITKERKMPDYYCKVRDHVQLQPRPKHSPHRTSWSDIYRGRNALRTPGAPTWLADNHAPGAPCPTAKYAPC